MNYTIVFLSVLFSVLLAMFTFNLFIDKKIKNKLRSDDNPFALSLYKSAVFIICGIIMSELFEPFDSVLQILPSIYEGTDLTLRKISFYSVFLGSLLVLLFIIQGLSSMLFRLFTKGKSLFYELANDDLKSAILAIGIMFGLAIAAKSGMLSILEQFIPYPELPIYN